MGDEYVNRHANGAEAGLATSSTIACVDGAFGRSRVRSVLLDVPLKVLNESRLGDGWSP